ncbi:hypothetical protein [Psychrobacter sp. WY6]|uniref:hypothetical protein n=1 Tax=Psychrobacter sp. WY6 TaxID=2708350 RepID=UPI002022DADC|nr:hypothetical protein [Psychrobacter sp. WY6]
MQQFCPDDYLQGLPLQKSNSLSNLSMSDKQDNCRSNSVQALNHRLNQAFTEQTGSAPTGDIIGMLVCRNAGIF